MTTLRCRLVVLGDSAVGKSTLISQFSETGISKTYQMTQGVDYKVKGTLVEGTDYTVEFHILEISGNPIYENFIPQLVSSVNKLSVVIPIMPCIYMMQQTGQVSKT